MRAPKPKYNVGDKVYHWATYPGHPTYGVPMIVKSLWLNIPDPTSECEMCGQKMPAFESEWQYSFEDSPGQLPERCLLAEPRDSRLPSL